MSYRRRKFIGAALLVSSCLFLFAISGGAQDSNEIPGFTPAQMAVERQLEDKFRGIPDPAHAEANLRHLTSEPHMAGTEASHRVAEWLRDQYRSYGFDADIVTYSVWLALPRQIKLELTKPSQKTLASPEQPFPGDPDTYDKRASIAFNAYSPSGDITAPVVYVNYGLPEDYRELARLGIDVQGKVVIARYGRCYRGIKAKVAEENHAAALILYSDPQDDGYSVGDPYPNGPWRPMSGIQRGSIIYTQLYPGDPLTPGVAATPDAKRLAPDDAASLPRIPTMPINAQDAAVILGSLKGHHVARSWQGALPFTYHTGPGDSEVHVKIEMDYAQRPIYDVIAKLHGTVDDQWVILGNHHDAWVFGAVDPGSGTASMLETARALGELVRSGWKPRRTIVMCEWDGEEPGLLGSTEWVEANRAELQAKAVAYINTDIGVGGSNFSAGATPSLKAMIVDVTRDVSDPATGLSVYTAWREHEENAQPVPSGTAREVPQSATPGGVEIGSLGSGSDYSAFLDFAGIPAMDVGFNGDYGVYHSLFDDFYWMKHFGDPNFVYHAALARVLGTIALRLDEADLLPFDYSSYASDIEHAVTNADTHLASDANQPALEPTLDAAAKLSIAAAGAEQALRAISSAPIDPAKAQQINHALAAVEQAFLAPNGLVGRPWFKHTIYAPGSYTGYSAEIIPGVTEALARNDSAALRQEAASLTAALQRAAARLDEVAHLAQSAAPAANGNPPAPASR